MANLTYLYTIQEFLDNLWTICKLFFSTINLILWIQCSSCSFTLFNVIHWLCLFHVVWLTAIKLMAIGNASFDKLPEGGNWLWKKNQMECRLILILAKAEVLKVEVILSLPPPKIEIKKCCLLGNYVLPFQTYIGCS